MSNQLYFLDTDISSYLLRGGHRPLGDRYRRAALLDLAISVVSQAELLYGLKSLPLSDPRRAETLAFLSFIPIAPWTSSAAEAYADIRHSLTTTAQLIGELDMMIAAHALALDAILVTNNTRHFERIAPPLRLENWTQA